MGKLSLIALLPRTDAWTLRLAVLSASILLLSLGSAHLWLSATTQFSWISLFLSVVLIGTSVFLWKLKAWARKATLFVLGAVAVVVPIGIASPDFFLDYWRYYDGSLPLWLVASVSIAVVEVAIFCCMFVINKHKGTFN